MALWCLSGLFGRAKLTALESQVLAAVSAGLSLTAREVFNKQIGLINIVQRHADGKEANFYPMRRGKSDHDAHFLFPLRREAQLATVELLGARAAVWLVGGWVFSIEFSMPPRRILEAGVKVIKVVVLHGPMVAVTEETTSEAERREEVLATIRSKLPDEYLELASKGKGISINDWTVSGVQDIRKIVQRDGNYYLLAEKAGMGAIGVQEDESSGQLYYLDYGDDQGERITVGLRKFLEDFDGGKVAGRF